ncbi:alpha/beta fold hydrolase [Candidatus Cyanaurora vandensis]|uniref:alpha/beta fold hydrolase n=1 Tax=Candidatus Cyanaurora vandensis TaxID=2714958 RepID=UPI00257B16D3|nr:alpha/beta fold hydrolase [Candidatus Cyanaurora vandensis]
MLNYQVHGAGPLVLLIHGAASNHGCWQPQSRYLTQQGYRVATVDLPGHGRSPGPCTLASCVEQLAPILCQQPQAVVGYSLGGVVAIELMRVYPVAGLFLVCPAVMIPPFTRHFYDWMLGWPLDSLARLRRPIKPLLRSPMARLSLEEDPTTLRQVWPELRDWQSNYQHLTMPVWVGGGHFDHIAPPTALRQFTRAIPTAHLTLFRGRHRPMESDPRNFNRWLVQGLQTLKF